MTFHSRLWIQIHTLIVMSTLLMVKRHKPRTCTSTLRKVKRDTRLWVVVVYIRSMVMRNFCWNAGLPRNNLSGIGIFTVDHWRQFGSAPAFRHMHQGQSGTVGRGLFRHCPVGYNEFDFS
jgi:hypothetical protein